MAQSGMAQSGPRGIVIAGGGTAGWMAAAALSRFLPAGTAISLVESDAIGTVGVGEATIPQIRLFNHNLGIDENELLAQCAGTIKLGIEFDGWSGEGSRYIHAFGTFGRALGVVPFHHYWLRAAQAGASEGLWDYSVAAVAAAQNRFAPDSGTARLPSGLAWAYQFDASRYAALLRRHATSRGVERIEGRITSVESGDDGSITALTLEDGRSVTGDFFIDCTGFRALLIGEALGVGYDDWRQWLPCDRAMAVQSSGDGALAPYTRAIAREAGWQWRIPLQHRTGNGLVWCSDYGDEAQAHDTLLAHIDGTPITEPRTMAFMTGRRRSAWATNCVALGLAAGFLEPLESTSIHLIQSGIARLVNLFPHHEPSEAGIAEYNRQTAREWEAVREFLILHYHANGRDEPFWRDYRKRTIPDALAHRIELFRETGRIFREGDELFTEIGWLQVMIGQGIVPDAYHPIADAASDDELSEFLALARQQVRDTAARMPAHADYLRRHAPAAEPIGAMP